MPEFCLSPAAERDLESIWDHSVREWGAAKAERYVDTLLAAFEQAAVDPTAAASQACDAIRPGYRRRLVQRHAVYYRVMPYGVAVIRVLHQRMDAARHLG